MYDTKNNFAEGSILSHIMRLSIPMITAQLINILYNIIDRIFIGHMPYDATNALTGLGVAFPICTITIAFANLAAAGGGPLFAIARGRGDNQEAEAVLGNCFTLLMFFGVFMFIAGNIFADRLLYLFGASDATFGYARDYISIYLCGSVFVMLSLGLNCFITAQGFAKSGMVTVSIGALANVILDPIFIFVLNMGIKGAAYATVVAQLLACIWTLAFLTGRRTEARLKISNMRLGARRVARIAALGISGFTMQITNGAVQIVCNRCLLIHGGDIYITAMTVINSVREVMQLAVTGIGSGSQPIISFNYGADKPQRVTESIRTMAAILLAYTVAAWVLVMIFAPHMVTLFNKDAALLPIAVKSIHIYFFGFFMMAFQFTGQTVFQALGRAKSAVFFSLLRKVIIVIPLTCLLPMIKGIGVYGVFAAEPVSNFLGGAACFAAMYFTVYVKMKNT